MSKKRENERKKAGGRQRKAIAERRLVGDNWRKESGENGAESGEETLQPVG